MLNSSELQELVDEMRRRKKTTEALGMKQNHTSEL
jgi:hypothetical protein